MSNIADRLAALYARASMSTLCDALESLIDNPLPGDDADTVAVQRQVRTWLIGEIERCSLAADAAAEKLCSTDEPVSHETYVRVIVDAARADIAGGVCA